MPFIGEVIKLYRINAGLTQAMLGEKIGVVSAPQKRIAEWESGGRTPAADYLLRLMAVLKIPPDEFEEYRKYISKSN